MEQWIDQTNAILQDSRYMGASLLDWGVILLLTGLFWVGLKFIKNRVFKKFSAMASHTQAHWDDIVARALGKTHGIFLFVTSLYLAANMVGIDGRGATMVQKFFVVAVFFQAAIWGNEVLAFGLGRYLSKRYGNGQGDVDTLQTYSVINATAKFILWTVLFLLLLDNLGVNITALVTGLGIGGIAVALAVQNILGDIFASLSIVMDRPFEVGDFIVVDDKSGTVEAIGLKTSRVRALSGEQLIFPNRKLVESEIQNFKRMALRRVEFTFRMDYETPKEALQKIPEMVATIIKSKENVKFDRAHLSKLGENALEFQAVYIVNSTDYNLYMDIQQQIYFEIIEATRALKAPFYYPTPSVLIDSANVVEGSKVLGNSIERLTQNTPH